MTKTIEVPTEVLETLIALSGTGQYGTPTQRLHLADAQDLLAADRIQEGIAHQGPEQLTLFDASVYDVPAKA